MQANDRSIRTVYCGHITRRMQPKGKCDGDRCGGLSGDLQSAHNLKLIAVVGADGLMVESAASHDCDAEAISAVAANGLLMMSELGQELGDGDAEVTTLRVCRPHCSALAAGF